MSAKEMFKKLKYELTQEESMMGTLLSYEKKSGNGYECIQFRQGACSRLIKVFYEDLESNVKNKNLTLEELQAINQQVKELKW